MPHFFYQGGKSSHKLLLQLSKLFVTKTYQFPYQELITGSVSLTDINFLLQISSKKMGCFVASGVLIFA